MSDVFISYSRKDSDFVRQLTDNLKSRQRHAWVDWQGIDYSTHWWEEICAGIDGADNFVIVLSMNSLNSKYCHQEIEHARLSSKRFIPILYELIDEAKLVGGWYINPDIHPIEALARENWEALKQIQFIDRTKLDGDQLVEALLHTVDTDVERVQSHTELLLRLQDWEKRGHTPSALLRGEELISYEAWRDKSIAAGDEPKPTQAQLDFIVESRRVEDAQRAEQAAQIQQLNDATLRAKQSAEIATLEQRRAAQRTRIALGVIGIAVIVGILATYLIVNARQHTALANQSADNAQNTVVAANATLTPIPLTLTFVAKQDNSLQGLIPAIGNSLQQPDQQVAAVSTIIADNPSLELSYMVRGLIYQNQHQWDQALADYNQALVLAPTDEAAYGNRGNIYYALGKYDQALADFNQAVALNPKDSKAYNSRAGVYRVKKQFDLALADFTQAIALDATYADAYLDRGDVYSEQGKTNLALADFNQAIALEPTLAIAYFKRGIIYEDNSQYPQALADYTAAIRYQPTYANAYYGRASINYDQQHYAEALVDYSQAISLDPQFAYAYYYRAEIYMIHQETPEYSKALADYLAYKRLANASDADKFITTLQLILTATGAPPETITPAAS